jgi:ribosomal protein L32
MALALRPGRLRPSSRFPTTAEAFASRRHLSNAHLNGAANLDILNEYRLPSIVVALPSALNIRLPRFLEDIWGSILRAVPKKKTSYSKKRMRQLAGKALKDVESLVSCPACGQLKRAHCLCPACVISMSNPSL